MARNLQTSQRDHSSAYFCSPGTHIITDDMMTAQNSRAGLGKSQARRELGQIPRGLQTGRIPKNEYFKGDKGEIQLFMVCPIWGDLAIYLIEGSG